MAWQAAINLTELKQKTRETMTIEGTKILFIWHEQEIHAVQAQCPHLKMPLAKGCITDENDIVCPFHHSAFDLKTGAVKCWSPWPKVIGPLLGKLSTPKDLRIYPTRVEDDQIFVDIS